MLLSSQLLNIAVARGKSIELLPEKAVEGVMAVYNVCARLADSMRCWTLLH